MLQHKATEALEELAALCSIHRRISKLQHSKGRPTSQASLHFQQTEAIRLSWCRHTSLDV